MINFGATAIPPLIAVLQDKSPDVRYSAIRALGKLKAAAAAAPIIELYGQERDPRLRGCIVVALAQIGTEEVRKPILASFSVEKDERVRCLIVTAIGILCNKKGLQVLKEALIDGNPRVRANAVEALARIQGINPSELIAKLIRDPNNRVRANVCKVLWNTDPLTVQNNLNEMICSAGEMERASAAYAMGEIAAPSLLTILIDRLKLETGPKAREHICLALAKIGEQAIQPLKEVLNLENNMNVLFALQEINKKRRSR